MVWVERADPKGDPTQPQLHKCNSAKRAQQWGMVSNFKWQTKGHDGGEGGGGDAKVDEDKQGENDI